MNLIRQRVQFDKKFLDPDAIKTVKKINKSGYEAYLVGGCIRDLLLGYEPKDFDIATNATPEQIKELFKRSRIIGRRFKLVHVMFSARKFIEVATFRSSKSNKTSTKGMVLRDNYYGSLKDDVLRRDFTVNCLYFDIKKSEVIDYVDGLNDLKELKINMIGNPSERFEEDPVRMIRAVRFKVKLKATIDSNLYNIIVKNAYLISNVPPARLYEEVIKLFHNENSIEVFSELSNLGILKYLFSQTQEDSFIAAYLVNTSERIKIGSSVSPVFLFAVFLWSAQNNCFNELKKKKMTRAELMIMASEKVIKKQVQQVMMPRWLSARVKDIWLMQHRLENYNSKKSKDLISNPRFRMAYDFFLLRSRSIDKQLRVKAEYWTNIQK
ncbi:polynucleotide adenylyltransferase PcnB [Candidatus Thioglobus sp.]|nr:polynucleotide adenylyltransferase PcnB [Candidatus Thioglobus sp.]